MALLSKCFPCASLSDAAGDGGTATNGDEDTSVLSPLESVRKAGVIGAKYASSADILGFQANPIEFMQKNLVIVTALPRNEPDENRPVTFSLFEWSTKRSTIGKVYRLSPVQNGTPREYQAIRAYFCDYRQDICSSIRIGREANLLLTPTLSGCTIGVKPEHDGDLAFCHANSRTSTNQIESQVRAVHACLGQSAIVINPHDYRNKDGDMATLIGVFHKDNWNIHFSSYGVGASLNHSGFTRGVQIPVPARDVSRPGAGPQRERRDSRSYGR